jgi:uncharacterized membrane protein
MEQWLTPTLAATVPGVARMVPWLLLLGIVEIVGTLVAGMLLIRAARRSEPRATSQLRDIARRMAKARIALTVVAALILALWMVGSAALGLSAARNELLLILTLGAVVLPAYVTITILLKTMSRAAEIASSNPQAPKGK